MIGPDERRHLLKGARPGERPGGSGLVLLRLTCPGGADRVLDRAREVLLAVLDVPPAAWSSEEPRGCALPPWFVTGSAAEQSPEEQRRWLSWWRSLPVEEKAAAERDQPWALSDWLHWMHPDERTWHWWDGRAESTTEAVVRVEVSGWPAPLGALEWLLRVAGADRLEDPEASPAS